MFRHVLVATDFTQGAAAALDRAFLLPLTADARVELVHVLPRDADESTTHRAGDALESELHRATASAARTIRCATSCVRGTPFVEIVRTARARDADLIVIGVHGRHPIRDLFVGSTASRVIRTAEVPVLLVRQPASAPYRDVLVSLALDDGDHRLVRLARTVSASRPSVIHVAHIPFENLQAPTAGAREELHALYRAEASAKLGAFLLEYDVDEMWSQTVVTGETRGAILEQARRQGCDLLIAGTHARSGLAHALLGSIAETLVLSAPCDVLVARPLRFTFELP